MGIKIMHMLGAEKKNSNKTSAKTQNKKKKHTTKKIKKTSLMIELIKIQ